MDWYSGGYGTAVAFAISRSCLYPPQFALLQTAVISVGCSRFHTVPQRVARWLKVHWYRSGIETFPFSAQFMAAQVGADHRLVAEALKTFAQAGVVNLRHNEVAIADQDGLTRQACDCFELAREATEDYLLALREIARSHGGSQECLDEGYPCPGISRVHIYRTSIHTLGERDIS